MVYTNMSPSLSVSISLVNKKFGRFLELPSKVERSEDIYYKSRSRNRRKPEELERMYTSAVDFVSNFDEKTEKWINEIERLNFNKKKIERELEKIRKNHQSAGIIIKRDITKELSPQIYFIAKKHLLMTKILLDVVEDNKDKMNFENLKEKTLEDEKAREIFKLGVFVAAEPILIGGLILAARKGNNEYINDYSRLINRFGFLFVRNFQDKFEKETGLDRPMEKKEFSLVQKIKVN